MSDGLLLRSTLPPDALALPCQGMGDLPGEQPALGSNTSSACTLLKSLAVVQQPRTQLSVLLRSTCCAVLCAVCCVCFRQPAWSACPACLLQELVRERFDPTKFLSVFKAGHPAWLDQLIQHSHSRKMIYELSAANKNSLLLNYAIQRILKQVCVG